MARIRFEEAPAGSDFSASPLVGLRQGFYVDRFSGALIDPDPLNADRIADFNAVFGVTVTRVPDFVEVSTNRVVAALADRTRAICNVNIIFTGDSSLRPQVDGAHASFYNCKISMAAKTNIGENSVIGTHAEAITTATALREDPTYAPEDGGVITGSSSWNAYGCDIQAVVLTQGSASFTGGANSLQIGGDVIGSEIYFGGDRLVAGNNLFWQIAAKEGGRWIESEIASTPGPTAASTNSIVQYGAPTVVDGMIFRRFGFTIGQGGTNAGPKLQVNPAVSDYVSLFTVQGDGRPGVGNQGNIFQVVGYTTPAVVAGLPIAPVIANADSYVTTSNGQGGAILYQGYQPSYFTDLTLDTGIQNVRVRLYSTFAATAQTSAANNFGGIPDVSVGDRTGLPLNNVNQALSNANGVLVSEEYSFDNVDYNDGYYDFLRFTPNTTVGSATFGSTYGLEQTIPAGIIFAPIFDIRGVAGGGTKNFVQHATRFEERSFAFDIDTSVDVVATALEADTEYPVVETTTVPISLIGTLVKNSNELNDAPNISFLTNTSVSINDVRDAYRAGWWEFIYDLPDGITTLTDPLAITLDNDLLVDYIATDNAITVRANGLVADTGENTADLFTEDLNISTIDFDGGNIDGQTLVASGAITNVANIENAGLSGASITFSGSDGTITDSTIVSAAAITLPANLIGAGSNISANGFTGGIPTDVINFDLNNSGTTVTIQATANVSGTLLGNFTFASGATLSGSATIGNEDGTGQIVLPDNTTLTIDGPGVSIPATANVDFGDNIDVVLRNGATEESLFGTRDLSGDDVEIVRDPMDIAITNNGSGDLYLVIRDEDNTFIEIATLLGTMGSYPIPAGETYTIQVASSSIGDRTWQIFTSGAGSLDGQSAVVYNADGVTINSGVDVGYNSAGVLQEGWSIVTNQESASVTGFATGLNGQYFAIPSGETLPTFTGNFDPNGSEAGIVSGSTVYRLTGVNAAATRYIWNREDTDTSQGGWHISALDTNQQWAYGFSSATPQSDNLFGITTWTLVDAGTSADGITPGTNANVDADANVIETTNNEFGLNVPSGGDISPDSINRTVGSFKSSQNYANYLAHNGTESGITFPSTELTQMYFRGAEDGFIVHETTYGVGFRNSINNISTSGLPAGMARKSFVWNHGGSTTTGGLFRTIDGTDYAVTPNTLNSLFGTGASREALDLIIYQEASDGTLTRIGENTSYFHISNAITSATGTTLPANQTTADPGGTNTAGVRYLTRIDVVWDASDFPDSFSQAGGILQPGADGFGALAGRLRLDIVESATEPESSISNRTYFDINLSADPSSVAVGGLQALIADPGVDASITASAGDVVSIDGSNEDRANLNFAVVEGLSVAIFPTDEDGDVIAGSVGAPRIITFVQRDSATIDYGAFQTRTEAAIRAQNVATEDDLDDLEDGVGYLVSPESSKIPKRVPYDKNNDNYRNNL